MNGELEGRTIAILATDGVERVELEEPRGALLAAGARTELISIRNGTIAARQADMEPAGRFTVDTLTSEADVNDYDALLLPGGTVNPDKLRMNGGAVDFVKAFVETGKPIAAICHGPWTLVEADAVRGRRMTSWPSIRGHGDKAPAVVARGVRPTDGEQTRPPKEALNMTAMTREPSHRSSRRPTCCRRRRRHREHGHPLHLRSDVAVTPREGVRT